MITAEINRELEDARPDLDEVHASSLALDVERVLNEETVELLTGKPVVPVEPDWIREIQ